ncbi:MAG: hypothetical protein NVSMB9_15770 [Isosphaeraceae bacterium]
MSSKAEWQSLAETRVLDAQALLNAQRWSAVYYLVGYAVECGLKACVLTYVINHPDIIFRNKKFSQECWSHRPEDLLKLADLEIERNRDYDANGTLKTNWTLVNLWTEESRYQQKTQAEAQKLFAAVTDQGNGVLPWIRDHW